MQLAEILLAVVLAATICANWHKLPTTSTRFWVGTNAFIAGFALHALIVERWLVGLFVAWAVIATARMAALFMPPPIKEKEDR